jgi:imidazolonepropionase-like amidohydrolase
MRPKSNRRVVLVVLLLAVGACYAERREPPAGDVLAVVNGVLWDGSGAPPVVDAAVVIRGSRIVAAGSRAELSIPEGARLLDAAGGTLVPGWIDMHVHLSGALSRGEDPLTPWLEAGFTTLVDMGSSMEVSELLALVGSRAPMAPRVLPAGPIWTAPGGYPFSGENSSARELRNPAEAREQVETFLRQPEPAQVPALVKVAFERGFLADLADPGWPLWDAPVLRAVAEAARRFDRPAAAHVTQPEELRQVVEAGFGIIAHTPSEPLARELLELAASRGVTLVTTIGLWEEEERIATACENLRRYLALGGRIALGTDAPAFSEPGFPSGEVERLLGCGLGPRQILLSVTRDAARALGRERELGSLREGAMADLVVVDGDPLVDVQVLERPRLVVVGGEVVHPGLDSKPHERNM